MSLTHVTHEPTSLVQVDSQCASIEQWAEQCDSVPELRDATNKLAAIDQYLARTSTEGRSRVAAAMRRLEVRIGDLLGPAENPAGKSIPHEESIPANRRHEFRQMAAHPDVVEDEIDQSTDAAPASRRKVVDAIRQRTQRRPVDEWTDEERDLRRQLDDGDTIIVSLRAHPHLIQWATTEGRFERVDRRTKWGNPFEMPADGDRETVIRNYAEHYLPNKPSLLDHLGDLQGKALGCWCAPEPCHADVLKREVDG